MLYYILYYILYTIEDWVVRLLQQSTGGSSQRYPGFDSRRLPAFSLSSIFVSYHLYFQREARCCEQGTHVTITFSNCFSNVSCKLTSSSSECWRVCPSSSVNCG